MYTRSSNGWVQYVPLLYDILSTWNVSNDLTFLAQARFINLYGEDRAVRLANNQSVFPTTEPDSSTIYSLTSIMLLRQPEIELDRLNNLWVDKIAYTASWRRFLRERIDEWKNVITIVRVSGKLAGGAPNKTNSCPFTFKKSLFFTLCVLWYLLRHNQSLIW